MLIYVKETDGIGETKDITMNNFLANNMDKEPWEKNFGGGVFRHYACCPHCKNPIQLIGVFTPMKHGARPYGKHTDKPVQGFSYFDPEEYKLCPLFGKTKRWSRSSNRSQHNHVTLSILKTVHDHFDIIINIVQEFSGFRISTSLAEKMLEKYAGGVGPLYKGANGNNIPWGFAFRSTAQSIFGQTIVDEDLKEALKKRVKGIYFENGNRITKNPDGSFVGLEFNYREHSVRNVGGEIHEQMKLYVFEVDRKGNFLRDIYSKVIKFRHEDQNLLFTSRDRSNFRSRKLIEIGRDVVSSNYPDLDDRLAAAQKKAIKAEDAVRD